MTKLEYEKIRDGLNEAITGLLALSVAVVPPSGAHRIILAEARKLAVDARDLMTFLNEAIRAREKDIQESVRDSAEEEG